MSKKKIAIIDDHPMMCDGLQAAIAAHKKFEYCGCAHSFSKATILLQDFKPDLIILDLSLKDGDGIDFINRLKKENALPLTLVFSGLDEMIYAERCLRAGARGYVMKTKTFTEVLEAVIKIFEGDIAINQAVTKQLLFHMSSPASVPKNIEDSLSQLSDREFQIYQFMGQGYQTKQIGEKMHLSIKTVETYRARIMKKLNIHCYAELLHHSIAWACKASTLPV